MEEKDPDDCMMQQTPTRAGSTCSTGNLESSDQNVDGMDDKDDVMIQIPKMLDSTTSNGGSLCFKDQSLTLLQSARHQQIIRNHSKQPAHSTPTTRLHGSFLCSTCPDAHILNLGGRWSDFEYSDTSSQESTGNLNTNENSAEVPLVADDAKIPMREIEKALLKRAHITNEYQRLSELLVNWSAEELVGTLKEKLHQKDSKVIIALSILLPRSEFPLPGSVEMHHCVRCHKNCAATGSDIDVSSRGDMQGDVAKTRGMAVDIAGDAAVCVVPHPDWAVSPRGAGATGGAHCRVCGADFWLPHHHLQGDGTGLKVSPTKVNSYCFTGTHETDPSLVTYGDAVRTCAEAGCIELYV